MSDLVDFTQYLSLTPAAAVARCSASAIRAAYERGAIRGITDPSGRRWFLRADVERYAAARRRRARGRAHGLTARAKAEAAR
jgi:hypothetical protein